MHICVCFQCLPRVIKDDGRAGNMESNEDAVEEKKEDIKNDDETAEVQYKQVKLISIYYYLLLFYIAKSA